VSRGHLRALAAGSVALAIAAGACGSPGSDEFVAERDVPYDLDETTTTSTTLPPTTTIVVAPSTTAAEETTTTAVSELFDLYFVAGRGQLSPVSVALARDASLAQLLGALVKGIPDGSVGLGLRSAIPPDAELAATAEEGVATVDLPPGFFEPLSGPDQRLATAQMVLTLLRARGVGQVRFTEQGEPAVVFLGDGTPSEPGELLTSADYQQLLTGQPAATTTTTTTTTTEPTTTSSEPSGAGPGDPPETPAADDPATTSDG